MRPLLSKIFETVAHTKLWKFNQKIKNFKENICIQRCSFNLFGRIGLSRLEIQELRLHLSSYMLVLEYDILLKNVYNFGMRENALLWFRSYTSDRYQSVTVNSVKSQYVLKPKTIP